MIHHLVLFKLKPDATPEQEQELVSRLLSMQGKIPGLLELAAGKNITPQTDRIKGYTVGLYTRFENMDALLAYGPHPVHEEVKAYIRTVADDVIVMDF